MHRFRYFDNNIICSRQSCLHECNCRLVFTSSTTLSTQTVRIRFSIRINISITSVYNQIITATGSYIISSTVTTLNIQTSVGHMVSLVVRQKSNGVKGTNKQILRHLRTLVDKKMTKKTQIR